MKGMITNMKLRDFYENNGVDYDAFLRRLMGKEALVEKYIKIFLTDTTYSELVDAVAKSDYDLIEKKAHTLKGIALNLDLEKLSNLCMVMVGNIRKGETKDIKMQFEELKTEYERIVFELQC